MNLNKSKKGFTLIELLVVIAIIAMLLSILMPSLGYIKEKAKNLICSTNLRTLFTAWTLYTVDNNDRICNSFTYRGPSFTEGWGDPSSWAWYPWDKVNNIAAGPPFTDEERHEGVRHGSLFPYSNNIKVYACKGREDQYKKFRSYSIPDCFGGYWGNRGDSSGLLKRDYRVHLKANTITNPGRSYVFIEENDYRDIIWDSFVLGDGTIMYDNNIWGDSITVRHSGFSSFVFADGHTEFRKWSDETVEIMERPFAVWGVMPVTAGGIEDIAWLRDGWSM